MENSSDSPDAQAERRKQFWIDLVAAKISVPLLVALVGLYGALYVKDVSKQSATQTSVKPSIAQLKVDDGARVPGTPSAAVEHSKLSFIQNNVAVITKGSDQEVAQLKRTAATRFSRSDDRDEITSMIDDLRQSSAAGHDQTDMQPVKQSADQRPSTVIKPQVNAATVRDVMMIDYGAAGRTELMAGNFDAAVIDYVLATNAIPSDPSLWNSLAYAQLRSGQPSDAYQSIAKATRLPQTNARTQSFIAINATKILCALGKKQDATDYLKESMNRLSSLQDEVSKDGEFKRYCGDQAL